MLTDFQSALVEGVSDVIRGAAADGVVGNDFAYGPVSTGSCAGVYTFLIDAGFIQGTF